MLRTRAISMLALLLLSSSPRASIGDEPTSFDAFAKDYEASVRPLIKQYCLECHSTEDHEADVDLERFASLQQVRRAPRVWQKVAVMLDSREMPPKDAEELPDAERARLAAWVHRYLDAEAKASAGDPGPVVLRRLSNAEYSYTLRDLTCVASLEPAREFPVDGAAGEGFTNAGNALVMSPNLLTKYLDAAKEITNHAVLLPDGIRFSPHTTPRDWTDESLTEIRALYREFTDAGGADKVNLQGIVFDTNEGGRLPVEKYLLATLEEREALASKNKTIDEVARQRRLNAKYLGTLWSSLNGTDASLILDFLRARWRDAKPADAPKLTADVAAWQKGLWKFSTVGHIGKLGGPKGWLEPVNPLIAKQEVRFKLPASSGGQDVLISLVATDAGDGRDHDFVTWQQPRLVSPGRPDLLLRDVRPTMRHLAQQRERMFNSTVKYLSAADEAAAKQGEVDVAEMAAKYGLDVAALGAWLDYLGIGAGGAVELEGHFKDTIASGAGYDFIKSWGTDATPQLVANSSDQHVRIPGNMKPHSVAVHPSPTLRAGVGWQSPVTTTMRAQASVTHAHPECGNGVTWSLELRRGAIRRRLAAGVSQGGKEVVVGPVESLAVRKGDFVSLLIGPRDGNHACDLTGIELKLTTADGAQTWNLAEDVSSDVLAGNPHADRLGNQNVWHFYTETDKDGAIAPVVPPGSVLEKWQAAASAAEKRRLADAVQKLLTSAPPAETDSPDAVLHRQLISLGGPLMNAVLRDREDNSSSPAPEESAEPINSAANESQWGVDPALFGKHPNGRAIDAANLCVQAPSVIEVVLPADLAEGYELVTTAALDDQTGVEGSVQLAVVAGKADRTTGLLPSQVTQTIGGGQWTDDNRRISYAAPIVVNDASQARRRIESAFDDFRRLFPAALCYTKIVPVDEVVTLTLFYREDDHLGRLMLDEAQQQRLDRLWDELHYVSHDALTLVDAFGQLMEFATQDADPKVFEPLRKPINDRAAAFRQRLVDTEPKHLEALLAFAARAYRRPLTDAECNELRLLYDGLRKQDLPHDEAIRLTLARVLVAPAFLYRIEKPGPGAGQTPVSDFELASRLSYFLWSSEPDEELTQIAEAGRLHDPATLHEQAQRMLRDAKTRRLAIEFGCQWLHIRDFDQLDEKSERHFPSFRDLRGAMYEESIQFFTDLFQSDRSVLSVLDADYTFLNEDLARHYGIAGVSGPEWRRVDGVKAHSRGGILAQAATLARQSGASRTSPTLRGNWISEVLLGERMPRPPKGVPPIPEDEAATDGLTVRQVVERHSSDEKCAVCHKRIDPFGYSLEKFDAIGRWREKDLGDRPIDTRVKAIDGAEFEGLDGLRNYLLTSRRDAFVRQFCRKLLGYALGRAVQLSDEPLLAEMQAELAAHDYKTSVAVLAIVGSRQFREIRSRETAYDD